MTGKFLAREISLVIDKVIEPEGKSGVVQDGRYFEFSDGERVHTRWAVGDSIAVAESYEKAGMDVRVFGGLPGWRDKSRVSARYMPHRFVVERVRCVRVQELGEEDALRAGVKKNEGGKYLVGGDCGGWTDGWREMFARMFDIKGKVPYALNPWVIVYDITPVI